MAERYRRRERAIPPREPILARLSEPFLLNTRRNRVLLIDFPGGASPPPGMPVFGGPEALAEYLLAHRIRYVAYSYANASKFPRDTKDRFQDPYNSNRDRMTLAFQDTLESLGTTRRHVYDDGDMFVLDLATLGGQKPASDRRRARVRRTVAPSTGPRNSFLDLSGLMFND